MALRFLNSGYFAGKVGIGTESPGAKLEIKDGNLWLNGATSNYNPEIFFIDDAGPTGIAGAKIRYENNNGNLYFDHKWDTATSGFFFRNRVDGTPLDTMSLVNGNVGIGITTPQAPLSFAELIGPKIDFYHNTTSGDRYGIEIQSSELRIHSGAQGSSTGGITFGKKTTSTFTEAMRITNAGNVGIGTDSPLGRLQVNEYTVASQGNQNIHGELSVFANSGDDSLFLGIKDAAYPNRGWSFNPVTNGVNSNLQFKEHGSTSVRMTIESGGSVGINTTSPDFKLDVDGTFGVSDLPFNSSSVSVLVANETIGAETITNGDFATDADWTKASNVSISGGQATLTANSSAQYIIQGSLWPANSLSGQKVKLTYTIVSNSLNGGDFRIGGYTGASAFTLNGLATTVGTHNVILDVRTTAGDDNAIDLYITSSATSGALVIDNVSVKQVTSASDQIQKRELGTGAFGPTPVGAYLPLAGGTMTGTTRHGDGVTSYWGTGDDLEIYHNSSGDSVIQNHVGDLYFTNKADDKDIVFRSDDGAGGFETYFYLDGSSTGTNNPMTVFPDNSKLGFGNAAVPDLLIYHDSNNSYIVDNGTGDLVVLTTRFYVKSTAGEAMFRATENGACDLFYNNIATFSTTSTGVTVAGDIQIDSALLSNQENTDIDTGAEVVAQVAYATYTAAFFDFVVKKGTNVRSGTVYACHNGDTTPLVEFTETSTNDLGDTSDVTLSVDISGGNMRLLATVTSDDWSVKSLIRAI